VFAVSTGVALVAACVAVLVDPTDGAWPVALACVPAAALGAASGAVVNQLMGAAPPASTASSAWNLAPPEAAGVRIVYRTAWPPAIATLGASAAILAREAVNDGRSGVSGAFAGATAMAALTGIVVAWARFRDDVSAWWAANVVRAREAQSA
jgi:hypothetical protein